MRMAEGLLQVSKGLFHLLVHIHHLKKLILIFLISENVIRENQWGGVDIRRGGDPILKNNYICYGYSDGVVVGERGRGVIEGNHVYCM